ncbi:MAG: DedA family protein [Candidatus Peregrinibacteria bacterium]
MSTLVQFLLELVGGMGYLGVFALMAVESSFIPFPSEIVVPPAAYLAAQGEMNVVVVVLMGLFGSLVGGTVNYWIARSLGRLVVYEIVDKKWAKMFLLSRAKVERAEGWFLKYGGVSTFLGRLVPAVRQLISLPAGFVRMNYWKFLLWTGLGSGLWVVVLALIGYYFGANEEVLKGYYGEIAWGLGIAAVVILVLVVVYKRKK